MKDLPKAHILHEMLSSYQWRPAPVFPAPQTDEERIREYFKEIEDSGMGGEHDMPVKEGK